MSSLEKRSALVTGSGRNIGKAIALALAGKGANIVTNARVNIGEAEQVAEECRKMGVRAVAIQADASDHGQVREMARKALDEFGTIDILVNNVGIAPTMPLLEMTDEDWDVCLRTSLFSVFYGTRELIGPMVENGWGRIINIGGQAGLRGTYQKAHNAAAKMGVIGFTRSVATEFSQYGITCNHVGPGVINTSPRQRYYESQPQDQAYSEVWRRQIHVGRPGSMQEVADVAAFLASEEASYITGQTILVNGGMMYV